MRRSSGMTLMEIMMVLALMIITISVPVNLFISARNYLAASDSLTTLQFNARVAVQRISNELRQSSIDEITIDQNNPAFGIDAIFYELLNDTNGDGIPDLDAQGDPDWDNATVYSLELDNATGSLLKLDTSGTKVSEMARNVKSINFFTQAMDATLSSKELKVSVVFEMTDSKGVIKNKTVVSIINLRN